MASMKKYLSFMVITVVIFTATCCFAESMTVQVKKSPLRDQPSFLGKMIGEVYYGEKLQVVERKSSWLKVQTNDSEGWLHQSALTLKKIELVAGQSNVKRTAAADEMALAGKGFNAEVEKEFKKSSELDYEAVDLVESYKISDRDKVAFLEEGGLGGAEVLK